ncbi:alpha/beta fold hydrolase [Iodobacter sp. HSC-16F04]|uniref:Alpha/beta fold hydrolase n=1 Tax=Iodobacter violaceini TaxID=3044271 RepID=A0ABX0KU13_9NEIS|nr:alpha/beta fold hydrolase [Iodobacter violacea]NHQ87467.1 alpha/beta fold hydrolase [Iodobacter violacea]
MIQGQIHTLMTGRGSEITALFFYPQSAAKAAILIVPAMGVSQSYYAPLASWLAEQGFLVASFDYTGMGLSAQGDLRQLEVDILDWARFDCDTMLSTMTQAGRPLYWLGHSLGGQLLGLVPGPERITKAITIASGSGYWLENSLSLRWKVWWLWFVLVPVLLPVCGYFPGKRLRKVGNLPRGVMQQWRRWCLHPDYMLGVEGEAVKQQFAAFTRDITALSFTDDELMSAHNTNSLQSFYQNASQSAKRLSPQDIGVKQIGHFGFFKPRFADSLWQVHLLPELN